MAAVPRTSNFFSDHSQLSNRSLLKREKLEKIAYALEREDTEKVKSIAKAKLTCSLSNGTAKPNVTILLDKSSEDFDELKRYRPGTNNTQDEKGRFPVHLAIKDGRSDFIEQLIPKADNITILVSYRSNKHNLYLDPISLSVLKGQIACLDELKRIVKVTLDSVKIGSLTLLHLAIYARQFEMLTHLLTEYFEETNSLLNSGDDHGNTPIIQASILGDVGALILLIKKGANIECRDRKGRTAMHHAVINKQMAVIRFLASNNANLEAKDIYKQTSLDLLGNDVIGFRTDVENFMDKHGYVNRAYPVNFAHNPPENLVFKGGGQNAFLGAFKELERRDIFVHVKRIAGTSDGTIMAVLLSVGCNPKEIEKLAVQMSQSNFFDHPFTTARRKEFVRDNLSDNKIGLLKDAGEMIAGCITNGSPLPAVKAIALKLFKAAWTCTGICTGKKFLNWIEEIIEETTGIPHCTFGELADLIVKGKKKSQDRHFKHLHLFATRLSREDTMPVHFSSEDPEYKNLIISEAALAAVSIPIIFKPHILVYKRKTGDSEYEYYTSNETFVVRGDYEALMETIGKQKRKAEYSYIDGGLTYSLPVNAFDKEKYIHPGSREEEKEYTHFNPRTLGFCIAPEKKQAKVRKVQSAETIQNLIVDFYTIYRRAESLIDQLQDDPRNQKRILNFESNDFSHFAFSTTPDIGDGLKAMDEAEKQTQAFFEKQKNEIEGIVPISRKAVQRELKKKYSITQEDSENEELSLEQENSEDGIPLENFVDLGDFEKGSYVELYVSEAQARGLLTLGPVARNYIWRRNINKGLYTVLATFDSILIITLPLTIAMMISRYEESKSLKSRKLELLSLDDQRFLFFKHVGEGEFPEAEEKFIQHKAFFTALMKTDIFVFTLKECLINCNNKYYNWSPKRNDTVRFKRYMHFLRESKIIPSIIPRDFLYDLPAL